MGYKPKFSNADALALAWECMRADSMEAALAAIERVALTLPVTLPGASMKKKVRKAARRAGSATPRGWREEMMRFVACMRAGTLPFSIFAMHGNMKLPFVAFSALPIVTCPGAGECAKWCYSKKAWRTPGGYLRQLMNTLLLRFNRRAIIDAFKVLPVDITFRLYVDGDFDSLSTMQFWWNLLRQRSDILCYGYSKSWQLFVDWHGTGAAFPDNYVLNVSSGSLYDGDAEFMEKMLGLPVTRERFLAVNIDKKFMRKEKGYNRYDDPAYHAAVREAARALGYERALSCSGKCGDCVGYKGKNAHACGARKDDGSFVFGGIVAIGNHG
jgi:hypothetical protein